MACSASTCWAESWGPASPQRSCTCTRSPDVRTARPDPSAGVRPGDLPPVPDPPAAQLGGTAPSRTAPLDLAAGGSARVFRPAGLHGLPGFRPGPPAFRRGRPAAGLPFPSGLPGRLPVRLCGGVMGVLLRPGPGVAGGRLSPARVPGPTRSHLFLPNPNLAMDHLRSPVLSLLRGPLLFTPQGWVVLLTLLACGAGAAVVWAGGSVWPFGPDAGRALSLLLAWPVLVFLFYIRLCMPHFRASWRDTALLTMSALSLPLCLAVSAP